MANRTVKDAKSVRGTNPQYLVEKIIRSRIYDCKYWKEECFALTSELLVDKAMALRYIGGVHGGHIHPTPFLCLVLKMLQIQPEKEIVVEFIKNEEFKYVRALGAYYMRLTGSSIDCYKYLEPLYNDNRKLRRQKRDGHYELVYMDELIDELLREERLCDIILPRIQKRHVLEENNELEPKISALEDDFEDDLQSDDGDEIDKKENHKPTKDRARDRDRRHREERKSDRRDDKDRKRDRSRSRERAREKERDRERRLREKDREREREKEREREREREKERERERDRHHRTSDRYDDQRRRDRDRRY